MYSNRNFILWIATKGDNMRPWFQVNIRGKCCPCPTDPFRDPSRPQKLWPNLGEKNSGAFFVYQLPHVSIGVTYSIILCCLLQNSKHSKRCIKLNMIQLIQNFDKEGQYS